MKREIKKNAFTLIEILVVMAIIGILLALAVVGVRYAILYSHDQQNKQYTVQIQQVLNEYYSLKNQYPAISCPGSGFDSQGDITTLYNLITSGSGFSATDQIVTDMSDVYTKISNGNLLSRFGYCTNPVSAGQPTAYILTTQMDLGQKCMDSSKTSFYVIGQGHYLYSGQNWNYDHIPTDMGLSVLQNGTQFTINCFN